MTNVVNANTGAIEGDSVREFLDDQAEQWGESDLDEDAALEGLDGEEEGEQEEGEEEDRGNVKPMATDAMLRELDEINPAMAANVRGMQRRMSQQDNEFQGIKRDMLETRERMIEHMERTSAAGEVEDTDSEELPEGVTDQHLEMFEVMAKRLGYVPKSALDEEAAGNAANTYADNALRAAVDQYGDAFGTLNADGSVTVNSDVQDRLDRRLASLQDPTKGITSLELFELEFGKEITPTERSGEAPRPRRKRPANAMRRSTGSGPGTPDVKIFNPDRNDDSETVLDRAWALAKRELSS